MPPSTPSASLSAPLSARIQAALRLLPLAAAAWLVAMVVQTWALRLPHPYDLEWMEGGMLVHAWRLDQGLPLYTDASREWIPYIYPPGYASILAVLGLFFELGHPLGRALSIAGAVAAAAALVFGGWRHGRSWTLGLIAGALFLGCYRSSGAFYDLVRLDSVAIALLAWAFIASLERGRGGVEGAGMLLAAAFLMKQHAAIFGLPLLAAIALRDGRRAALRFALFSGAPALAVTLFLQWASDGHYLTYLLGVPAGHALVGPRGFPGTPREWFHTLPVLFVLVGGLAIWRAFAPQGAPRVFAVIPLAGSVGVLGAAIGWVLPPARGSASVDAWESAVGIGVGFAAVAASLIGLGVALYRRRLDAWTAWACGVGGVAIVTAALMRAHVGGFVNVHIPVHWLLCFGGVLVVAIWQEKRPGWLASLVGELGLTAQAFVLLHGFMMGHNITPTAADRAAGDALVERLRREPGPVCSPIAPWIARQAGHEPGWHLIALWDIHHRDSPMLHGVDDVEAAFRERHWPTLVDAVGRLGVGFGADLHYDDGDFVVPLAVFHPRTGWRARPEIIRHPLP